MNSGSPHLLVIPNADLQMENQEPGSYLDQLLTFKKKKSTLEKAKSILINVGRNVKKVGKCFPIPPSPLCYITMILFFQVYYVILSIWNTLSNVCSKKKEEESGESEGNSPSSDSVTSSKSSSCDHVAVEMEPEPAIDTTAMEATPTAAISINSVDKPITPDEEKPMSPTAAATPSTPVSAGKRVQTPVKPIKGAGPEANPSWISSNQNQNETRESESKLGSSENKSH